MPIDAVVADANALLSCMIGRAALRVITDYRVGLHAARFNVEEVRKYLPSLAAKYQVSPQLVEIRWGVLSFHVYEPEEYCRQFPRALAELEKRDPKDAHALALARALGLPLWSNDRDFASLDIECYSTARLLERLAREQSPE